MPDKERNVGTNPTPHFDGEREGILNDPTGVEIGVEVDLRQTETPMKNPFYIPPKNNEEMEKFEKLTRGKPVVD